MIMVFNKNIWVYWGYGDRGFGKMITSFKIDGLSYTYKISNNIYPMITIINSKIFVDKSVDKTYPK
jgi:hypothetical protein